MSESEKREIKKLIGRMKISTAIQLFDPRPVFIDVVSILIFLIAPVILSISINEPGGVHLPIAEGLLLILINYVPLLAVFPFLKASSKSLSPALLMFLVAGPLLFINGASITPFYGLSVKAIFLVLCGASMTGIFIFAVASNFRGSLAR